MQHRQRGTGKEGSVKERKGAIRCNEMIFSLHDAFDIAELQLVIAIELFDDGTIFLPVLGSARTKESGRRGG